MLGIDRHPTGMQQRFLRLFALIGKRGVGGFTARFADERSRLAFAFLGRDEFAPGQFEGVELARRLFFGVQRDPFPAADVLFAFLAFFFARFFFFEFFPFFGVLTAPLVENKRIHPVVHRIDSNLQARPPFRLPRRGLF